MREINIKIIPHNEQRYETCGDYYCDENGVTQIRVSEMCDIRHTYLVMIHELAEVMLTDIGNIPESEISKFDIDFENKRQEGNFDEPGDDPEAPYVYQHCIATAIERVMCVELGCLWKKYEEECNSLKQNKEKE